MVLLAGAGVGTLAVMYAKTEIPSPNWQFETETSYVYYDDGKTVLGKFLIQDRDSVDLDQMGTYTAGAAVAAEDRTFYTNEGIDIKGVARALVNNVRGRPVQGGSTITQQYIKVLYLTQERTYKRKLREILLALKLNRERSKEQILQGYLNTVYCGRGSYGVQACARSFFGVAARDLTLAQSATLAALINAPSSSDPARGPEAAASLLARYRYVLDGMAQMGAATLEQTEEAAKQLPLISQSQNSRGYVGQTGYVMDMIREQLLDMGYADVEIDGSGLRIHTTISKEVMAAAATAVEDEKPRGLRRLHIAAAVVDPRTGGLKGIHAGAPYEKTLGGINWALAGGGAGSTFKPFALATGLSNGETLSSTHQGNSPVQVGSYAFHNEGSGSGTSYGAAVPLSRCLELSINTCFIDLTTTLPDGADQIRSTIKRMGVPAKTPLNRKSGLHAEVGVALGSATVSAVDLANAYGSIANQGQSKRWYVVSRINSHGGRRLYEHHLRTRLAVSQTVAADTTCALEGVVRYGTGRNALALGRPAAGKTGTATDGRGHVRSSWFVGFTGQLSAAVMYVRGNGNEPLDGFLPSFYGADYPTRTWTNLMAGALDGQPVAELEDGDCLDPDADRAGEALGAQFAPGTQAPGQAQSSSAPTSGPLPTDGPNAAGSDPGTTPSPKPGRPTQKPEKPTHPTPKPDKPKPDKPKPDKPTHPTPKPDKPKPDKPANPGSGVSNPGTHSGHGRG